MPKHFISEPLTICHPDVLDCHREILDCHPEPVEGRPSEVEGFSNEPHLPAAFQWRGQTLEVKTVRARRRSTKVDRGDTYLKRHWFEIETSDGRIATVYYDRAAKRGQPHWWLYSIEECFE